MSEEKPSLGMATTEQLLDEVIARLRRYRGGLPRMRWWIGDPLEMVQQLRGELPETVLEERTVEL